MKRRYLSFALAMFTGCAIVAVMLVGPAGTPAALANNTYQSLPYNLVWQANYVVAENDWSAAAGVLGYSGSDGNASGTTRGLGADPRTVLDDLTTGATPVVHANELSMSQAVAAAYSVIEFHPTTGGIAKATLALHANSSFDAPFIMYHLNTTGMTNIRVQYDVADIDQGNTDAFQPVALHYRIGNSGAWTNVPAGYITDATAAIGQPLRVTHIDATLPAAANNQAQLQIRVLTTNAPTSDEFIGIDNVSVTGTSGGGPTPVPTATTVPPTPNPALTNKTFLPFINR